MPRFTEFQWAVFLYWAVSYGGNIGGDQDYVPLMSDVLFLERLRNNPRELTIQEISKTVILFLNKWKCMVKDDGATAEAMKSVLVESKAVLQNLGSVTILDVVTLSDSKVSEISSLYNKFDGIPHIGPTATSKTMHILKPDLFVMWDSDILSHYGKRNPQIDGTGNGYLAFLSTMSKMAREVTDDFEKSYPVSKPEIFLCEKLGYTLRKSLAKFMDEYNWITITKGITVPPRWWPNRNDQKVNRYELHNISQGVMGAVMRRWEEAGRPDWSLEKTIDEVKRADALLYRDGLGKIRHRKLRQHIEQGDEEYVRRWTLGCHFCWVNPRGHPCPICGRG